MNTSWPTSSNAPKSSLEEQNVRLNPAFQQPNQVVRYQSSAVILFPGVNGELSMNRFRLGLQNQANS